VGNLQYRKGLVVLQLCVHKRSASFSAFNFCIYFKFNIYGRVCCAACLCTIKSVMHDSCIILELDCSLLKNKFVSGCSLNGAGVAQSVQCLTRIYPLTCVQTGSGAHPASCTMGTGGPFPGAKRGRGVTLTTHPHVVPRSRMSRSYTSSPLSATMACSDTAINMSLSWFSL
jgi:hypothetical protein